MDVFDGARHRLILPGEILPLLAEDEPQSDPANVRLSPDQLSVKRWAHKELIGALAGR